ncbi:MAG: F0F1 ATP synthase subunit epsilon [Clostridia bacterium]|jgi:F-type H+-transporting ATPase subunit epsilon|nr:F0F1 ATP synthase subunit epsilon [Clostridia bacterium]
MSESDVAKDISTFRLKISSPDGDSFKGRVSALYVRTTEGDMAVLPGHAPLIAVTVPCAARYVTHDNDGDPQEHVINVTGGLLSVDGDKVTLLAGKQD